MSEIKSEIQSGRCENSSALLDEAIVASQIFRQQNKLPHDILGFYEDVVAMRIPHSLVLLLLCALSTAQAIEQTPPEKKLSVAVSNTPDETPPSREAIVFMTQLHQISYKAFTETELAFGVFRTPPMVTHHSLVEFNKDTFERVELIGMTRAQPVAYAYYRQKLGRVGLHVLKPEDVVRRPMTDFEKRAIVELKKGRDIVLEAENPRIPPPQHITPEVVKAAGKAIYAVGALYARKDCIECHEVREGTILGAFTYRVGTTFVDSSIKQLKEKSTQGSPPPKESAGKK